MEKEGLPNAGLYDQRAVLQWIQKYVHLVGGDKTQVSAWGESAGAGSVMHQLVAFGGTQDPLFTRAVLESPAFAIKFDRKGDLEKIFQNFTQLAGCTGQGVACLRAASAETLRSANTNINLGVPPGTFAVGPSTDGKFVRQLAALELASGNFYKGIESLIISHVRDEAFIFVPPTVQTDADFTNFIQYEFPTYAQTSGVIAAIEARYPPVMSGSNRNYSTEFDRTKALLAEGSFQCNNRYLHDAYAGIDYQLQYSVTPGIHGSDVIPTFYNLNVNLTAIGIATSVPVVPGFGGLAQAYQSYLTSHARTGNPNTFKQTFNVPPAINWPKPSGGDELSNVLNVGDLGFSLISDPQTTESKCDFWRRTAAAVTNLGGKLSASFPTIKQVHLPSNSHMVLSTASTMLTPDVIRLRTSRERRSGHDCSGSE